MNKRFNFLWITLSCLVFSGSLSASEKEIPQVPKVEVKSSADSKKALKISSERLAELQKIQNDANDLASVLASEILLQNGDIDTAMTAYAFLFNRSKRPEIAERGMQIALDAGAIPLADVFYEKWREIENPPSFAQKNMALERAVTLGEVDNALTMLPELIKEANDSQRKRIFLYASQLAINNPEQAKSGASLIHRLSGEYPNMSEAIVADVLYATINKKHSHAISGLKRLSTRDDVNYATLITLAWISQKEPEILDKFFHKTDSKSLPEVWKSLYIENLILLKKYDEAYSLVLNKLEQSSEASTYIQAGSLAALKGESLAVMLNFFEKAYAFGNKKEQSQAALLASMRIMYDTDRNLDLLKQWTDKIHDGYYDFDKNILLLLVADDRRQVDVQKELLDKLEKIPAKKGNFFNEEILNRLRLFYIVKSLPHDEALNKLNGLLDEALEKNPNNKQLLSQLYHARGNFYADYLHQPEKAVGDLEKYLQFDEENPDAQNALGYTLLFIPDRIDEGVALIEKAYKKMPDSPAIQDSLGWGYYLQGKVKKALPYLQKSFSKMPEAEIAAHLGEVLWELNRKDEAREVWQKGFNKESDHFILQNTLKKYQVTFE
ncbi:MAG: hypothetical protein IK065_04985 [Neisseriaceae bacterium]|nr:hypothetical protein [Neisseriaceae bacterium]